MKSMKDITTQDRMAEGLERVREEKQRMQALLNSNNQAVSEEEEKEDELFSRLKTLMKDRSVFTNVTISRKAIADQLGTNEKHLRYTISRNTGMGFTAYVNSVRLLHARQLLSHPDKHDTIDAIAIDSGFRSRTTFFRIFRNQYGLSPDEFRKLLLQTKQTIR
jgi:AraC-like DNA-binding protein